MVPASSVFVSFAGKRAEEDFVPPDVLEKRNDNPRGHNNIACKTVAQNAHANHRQRV